MYAVPTNRSSKLSTPNSYEAESLERELERKLNNNEPIEGDRPMIYSERKDGVIPEYDIRTDKHEIAVMGMDYVARKALKDREDRHKPKETKKDDGKPEPSQATEKTGNQ